MDPSVIEPGRRPMLRYAALLRLLGVIAALVSVGYTWYNELPLAVRREVVEALPTTTLLTLAVLLGMSMWISRRRSLRAKAAEDERDRIFSLALDILCVMTLDGRFRRTNPAFAQVLGRPPESLIGKNFSDIVHPDDAPTLRDHLRALAQGRQRNFEIRGRCGDGISYRWLSWTANPLPEEGLIYAVAHDISARKTFEDALRAETAFRQAMEESVSTGLCAIDPKGRILYVNRAFCELVGQRSEELLGHEPPYVYWVPEELQQHWQSLALCLSGKAGPEGLETRVRRSTGVLRDVRLQVSPLIDSEGTQTGWMTAMTDITESRRARAQLEQAHERFTTVLDGLDAAVFVTDAATQEVLYANRAFLNEHGSDDAHPPLPQPELVDYLVDPRHIDPAQIPCELFDGELQHPTSNQWFHVRERATRWVDGRIVRLVVATNITALKRVEEMNREQEARLQRTSRLITMGEMASTLAHELNQPLSAIANYSKGCVNRIKSGQFEQEELLRAMEKTNTQAALAGQILRRVRDFVRKSEPKRSAVSLYEVTQDALDIAEIEAQRLGVRIETHISPDLPQVYADRVMVEQILLNLIKNAAEAESGQDGSRCRVTVTAERVDAMLQVSVTDWGHGISEEHRAQLFSAFFTTKAEGMGMGLNICRSIIEFHNGRLWVDPNPEGGSIFRFTLPLETRLEPNRADV